MLFLSSLLHLSTIIELGRPIYLILHEYAVGIECKIIKLSLHAAEEMMDDFDCEKNHRRGFLR
jgi:hypothetical protein